MPDQSFSVFHFSTYSVQSFCSSTYLSQETNASFDIRHLIRFKQNFSLILLLMVNINMLFPLIDLLVLPLFSFQIIGQCWKRYRVSWAVHHQRKIWDISMEKVKVSVEISVLRRDFLISIIRTLTSKFHAASSEIFRSAIPIELRWRNVD